jgi:hypothetical protein
MNFDGAEYKIPIVIVISIIGIFITYVNTKMAQVNRMSSHQNILQVIISLVAFVVGLSFHAWLFIKIGWYAPILSIIIGLISYLIAITLVVKILGPNGIQSFLFGFIGRYMTFFEIFNAALTLILWFGD